MYIRKIEDEDLQELIVYIYSKCLKNKCNAFSPMLQISVKDTIISHYNHHHLKQNNGCLQVCRDKQTAFKQQAKAEHHYGKILQKPFFAIKIHVCRICVGYVETETKFSNRNFPIVLDFSNFMHCYFKSCSICFNLSILLKQIHILQHIT